GLGKMKRRRHAGESRADDDDIGREVALEDRGIGGTGGGPLPEAMGTWVVEHDQRALGLVTGRTEYLSCVAKPRRRPPSTFSTNPRPPQVPAAGIIRPSQSGQ